MKNQKKSIGKEIFFLRKQHTVRKEAEYFSGKLLVTVSAFFK